MKHLRKPFHFEIKTNLKILVTQINMTHQNSSSSEGIVADLIRFSYINGNSIKEKKVCDEKDAINWRKYIENFLYG